MQFGLNQSEFMQGQNGCDFKGNPDSFPSCALAWPSPTQLLLLGLPAGPAAVGDREEWFAVSISCCWSIGARSVCVVYSREVFIWFPTLALPSPYP